MLIYASNIPKKIINLFFFSKVQSVKPNCVYLLLCAVLRWLLVERTVLIFLRDIVSLITLSSQRLY